MNDDGICGVCHQIDEENFDRLQIQCDGCNAWYHCSCVNLEEYEIDDIDHYHCDKCVRIHGPSKEKPIRNRHRHDYSEANADVKPMQSGTYQFVHNLKRRKFPELSHLMIAMDNGYDFTYRFIESCSFDKPILVRNIEGLGATLPPSTTTIDDIEQLINADYEVDVIDVQRQHSYKMKFQKFLQFYRQPKRKRVYNLISLEFSGEKFSDFVKLPSLVEEISWVTQFWPKKFDNAIASGSKELFVLNEHVNIRPEVSKFCLIGMRDSYTDFHVDFGGTSVWYHVLWGEKWFYLIEPTDSNLALYENWSHSTSKSENFFGDEVEKCYLCVLKPGQTLFIPTGWIHAVLTPIDSLVFGGNFLHSFNIPLQLRVYEMELKAATPEKFMFPHFELLNWYAGIHLLEILKDSNDEKVPLKPYLSRGIRALISAMKRWIARNQTKKGAGLKGIDKIESVTCVQLLKSLEKSVVMNEKFVNSKKQQKRPSQRPRELSNKSKLSSVVIGNYSTSKKKTATIGPMKVVPGSFINARSKVDKTESDLTGCPKTPLKISLKPGVWSLPVVKPEQKSTPSPPSPPLPPPSLKLKLSLTETTVDEPKVTIQNVVVEKTDTEEVSQSLETMSAFTEMKPVDDGNIPDATADESLFLPHDGTSLPTTSPPRRKVGFSLLDLNKMPSPPTSSVVSPDILPMPTPPILTKKIFERIPAGLSSNAGSKHEAISNVLPKKLKLKIPKVKTSSSSNVSHSSFSAKLVEGTDLTGIFGVSKRGRVQKMNQKVFGETGKATEFVPELGQCRKDEEFIYPPLIDSDGDVGRSSKKRPKKDDSSPSYMHPGKFSLTSFSEPLKKKTKKKSLQKQQQSHTVSTSSLDPPTASVDASSSSSVSAFETKSATAKSLPSHQKCIIKSKKKVTTAKQRLASKLKLHKKMIPTL